MFAKSDVLPSTPIPIQVDGFPLVVGFRPRIWGDHGSRAVNPPIAFKVRKTYGSSGFSHKADAVIVLTDKPQSPIPLDWDNLDAPATVAPVAVAGVPELVEA